MIEKIKAIKASICSKLASIYVSIINWFELLKIKIKGVFWE